MRISKFYFSITIFLIIFYSVAAAQEERIKGLRIGYDVSRLAFYLIETERTAFEISVDYEIARNFYVTAESGGQKYRFTDSLYNYNSDGYYTRLGLDYNILKNRADNQYEMVFAGFRYGFSRFTQSADNITIRENYWGPGPVTEMPQSSIAAHWIEVATGVRAELFKNVFIGWSFRWRILLYQTKIPEMKPIYIPGFGSGDKRSVIGFNYYVYFRIPLGKFH